MSNPYQEVHWNITMEDIDKIRQDMGAKYCPRVGFQHAKQINHGYVTPVYPPCMAGDKPRLRRWNHSPFRRVGPGKLAEWYRNCKRKLEFSLQCH